MIQDKGESPKDPVYDCVLQGLNLVAKQAALPLLDHLFTWRREALVRATRAGGEMIVLRKRVRLSCVNARSKDNMKPHRLPCRSW